MDLLRFSVLCLLCFCARLFICAVWSPAGKVQASLLSIVVSNCYEGGSICNENPFITPSTDALGIYAICQTKDQSVAITMVHETLFYLSNLISYRLFKKNTNIHCIYFPPNCKDSF